MNDWHQTLGPVLNSDAPLSRAGVIGAAVCVVWGAAVAAWCAVKLRRRWSGRRRFARQALERGFDLQEAMNLWRIARFSPEAGNREAILASCEAFDRCLRAAEEAAGDDPVLWPEYLAGSVTSALRRKYGNTRRARQRIGDTHEIEANQPVRVRLGPSRTTFESFVLNVAQDSLQLSLPADVTLPPAMELADCPAFMSFWRPHDARYECTARVTRGETSPRDRRLVLSHASLNRVQEREHVRVRCGRKSAWACSIRRWPETRRPQRRAGTAVRRDAARPQQRRRFARHRQADRARDAGVRAHPLVEETRR